jgi:ABC-2 type transport system permease protein
MMVPNRDVLQPRRYGRVNWIGLRTLLEREIFRFLKVGGQTVLAPLVSSVLFMMIFSVALGARGHGDGALTYADFLAPGLMMLGLINNAFANTSSSLIIAKMQGNSVDFLMPPLSALELTIAFLGGSVARGMLVAIASAVSMIPFADVVPVHWEVVFYFALMAALIFGAIGLIGGIWADKFDQLATVTNFVVLPLTMLSGTFFSLDRLSEWARPWAHANPVFLLIDGFRYGYTGRADGDVLIGASVAFALAAALSLASWALLRSGWRLKA